MALLPADEELDLEARIGLLGTSQEKQQAILLLTRRYEAPLMKFLGAGFADLDLDERASVIQDAFIVVYQMAESRTLDTDNPLKSLIFTVAKRRAIDARRKNSRRIRTDCEITDEVANYLAGTQTGRDWRLAVVLEKTHEIIAEFRQFVNTLKGQQKRVASVMADFLPDWLSDLEIAQEIFDRTQQRITTMEVKGAKNALMKKFRETLTHKIR